MSFILLLVSLQERGELVKRSTGLEIFAFHQSIFKYRYTCTYLYLILN